MLLELCGSFVLLGLYGLGEFLAKLFKADLGIRRFAGGLGQAAAGGLVATLFAQWFTEGVPQFSPEGIQAFEATESLMLLHLGEAHAAFGATFLGGTFARCLCQAFQLLQGHRQLDAGFLAVLLQNLQETGQVELVGHGGDGALQA